MKLWILIFLIAGCAHHAGKVEFHCEGEPKEFVVPAAAFDASAEKLIPHSGLKKFENYLTISLPKDSFVKLFEELQIPFGKLKSRGEAHVTLITPPEYDELLGIRLSMDEINKLAEKLKVQTIELKPICIGRSQVQLGDKVESTYYIVLEREPLIEFRKQIAKAFAAKGCIGFTPENYNPHITIGFSLRDLYESDGVIKDQKSCISKIKESRQ